LETTDRDGRGGEEERMGGRQRVKRIGGG